MLREQKNSLILFHFSLNLQSGRSSRFGIRRLNHEKKCRNFPFHFQFFAFPAKPSLIYNSPQGTGYRLSRKLTTLIVCYSFFRFLFSVRRNVNVWNAGGSSSNQQASWVGILIGSGNGHVINSVYSSQRYTVRQCVGIWGEGFCNVVAKFIQHRNFQLRRNIRNVHLRRFDFMIKGELFLRKRERSKLCYVWKCVWNSLFFFVLLELGCWQLIFLK